MTGISYCKVLQAKDVGARQPHPQKLLNTPFFQQVKSTTIADDLRYVDHHTQFIDVFGHVRKSLPIRDGQLNNLLATIIVNGPNYGIYALVNISDRQYIS